MPFKTGLGTAACIETQSPENSFQSGVSMPFKTGLGTAGRNSVRRCVRSNMFQCPLRRAWVLRNDFRTAASKETAKVSMPFKTGLGTAELTHCEERTVHGPTLCFNAL